MSESGSSPTRREVLGVERSVAQSLVDEVHQICLYSKATRGNSDVAIRVA